MADDKKIIFSMVGVNKIFPPQKQVLKNIYLSFFYGAKIGIIGLNGSGKSTLLKIIAGIDKDYQGEVVFSPGYSVGYLEQDPKLESGKTVKEIVQEGVQDIVDALKEFEEVNQKFGDPEVLENPDKLNALINRQAELQDKIDATDAWNLDSRLERAMDALRCPPEDQVVDTLSGGERRRVALCRLLLQQPDVLLLDEPTNHLDIYTRENLTEALMAYTGTLLLVTHDRHLMNSLACPILYLEDGKAVIYPSYDALMGRAAPASVAEKSGEPAKAGYGKEQRRRRAELRAKIKACEDEMEACGAREVELDNEINSPEVYNDPDLLRQKSDELSDLRFHQEELFAAWEAAMEEQEAYEQTQQPEE